MTRLDDLLSPLQQGVWEITVPKDLVTEPLGREWEKSLLNIPTPGTVASYRKGQYHAHETPAEWKVHIDRYDPKVHPFLHLMDDAPLLLMIADTFITLVASARRNGPDVKTGIVLKEQKRTWQVSVLMGFALALTAVWIVVNPLITLGGIIGTLLPMGIIVLGFFTLRKGISLHRRKPVSPGSIFLGISVMFLGFMTLFLPLELFIQILLLVLASWAFGSAYMSLSRVARKRMGVPEGFYYRLCTGVLSLLLALAVLLIPDATLAILMETFGVIVFLLGMVIGAGGLRLREKMKASSV